MNQSPVVKTVFYVNIFGLDIFREVLNTRPDLRFVGLRDDSPEAEASAVLASAFLCAMVAGSVALLMSRALRFSPRSRKPPINPS